MAYRIAYSRQALEHLSALDVRDRRIIVDAVREQLSHQPDLPTRNRKPMRPNPLAEWELRVRNFRVYYEVGKIPEPIVQVQGIGIKEGSTVTIGGEVAYL